MDALYHPQELPFIIVLCSLLVACAIVDWWKYKVPNVLTIPMILSGWAYGAMVSFHLVDNSWTDETLGHFWASLAISGIGLALLGAVYAIGGMGAGDVKMQTGYAAWIGAHYGWDTGWPCFWGSFCLAILIGGAIALVMIALRGQYRKNLAHMAAILHDLMNPTTAKQQADQRRPFWHRLPYGVPLCIGYITYILTPFRIL
jgi:prepilin peptidase CpaA